MNRTIRGAELLLLAAATIAYDLIISQFLTGAGYLDLSLVFTLYIGSYSPPVKTAICGTALGLLQDALPSGLYLGLNGFTKTVLGFGVAKLSRWIVWDRIAICSLVVGLLSLLDRLLVQLLLKLGDQPFYRGFWSDWMVGGIVTGLAGSLLFRLLDRIRTRPKWWREEN